MISLAVQLEVAQTLTSLGLVHTKKVRADVHRDSIVPEELARERNTADLKRYLWTMVNARRLHAGPTTIHGADGPVVWNSLKDHPKCNRGMGSTRWRSDKLSREGA